MLRASFLPAVLFLSVTVFSTCSSAAPIVFTFAGSGSGALDGNAFGISDFVITAHADTNNIGTFPGGVSLEHNSASIAITGLGVFDFVTATRTFFNDTIDTPGFSRVFGSDLLNGPFGSIDGWDMLSSIGPVAGSMQLVQWSLSPVITSGGVLVFNSGTTSGSFSAIVGASVPEESSTLVWAGGALVGLIALRRKSRSGGLLAVQ